MSDVHWLTSPELAAACRTGFAPGDRVGIIDALHAATTNPGVNTDVPWAMAGTGLGGSGAKGYDEESARTSGGPVLEEGWQLMNFFL